MLWGILRNPAYAGQAVYGKTKAINRSHVSEERRILLDTPLA